jgi:long-chain acyl-CoA synthetase
VATLETRYASLPAALLAQAAGQRDGVAIRHLEDRTWFEITWQNYRDQMLAVALGLRRLGLKSGDSAAILSYNSPWWLIGDLAAQCLGVATVPIYPNSTPAQVGYILSHAECRLIFCEDRAQLAKVREIWSDCPRLGWAVLLSDHEDPDDRVIPFGGLRHDGEQLGEPAAAALMEEIGRLDPDALATIVYTSGTTGPPKGAMLSQRNMVFEGESLARAIDADERDCTLSFLPLSHVAERLQGQIVALRVGYTINIGGGIPTVGADLRQVQPTLLVCVPRVWEKMKASIEDALESAPQLRRKIFNFARTVGWKAFGYRNRGERPPLRLWLMDEAARVLVRDKLRARLGMARVQTFASGAAPLAVEVAEFFASLGMPIQEVYGQTECGGVSNANRRRGLRFGTVGPALDGIEVRVESEHGEILVRGPNVFLGYHKEPEATQRTVVDGWLHTGDVGVVDEDGFLRITDRLKDIIVTAGGKNVAPQNIENRLKAIAGFSQVVVVGDKRKYLSALVTLDTDSLGAIWQREQRGALPEGEALCSDRDVRSWVQDHIERVNHDLARFETVKKFRILAEDFSVEGGELTPTLKVKRRVIQDRYEDLIDQFYEE